MNNTTTKPRLLALGGLIAMASALGIGRFIYTPILPPMAEGLLLTQGEAGLIASANFLGYLVGALAAPSPRLPGSSRGWLLAALAASAATTGVMGWGGSLELFLGLRFVGGAASAFVLVFASALVLERLAATGRSNLAAVHFAGVGTGIALSAVLTWALAAGGGSWRAMWFGGGAVSLVAIAAVALLVPAAQDAHVPKAVVAKAVRSPRIWPLVTAYGLFGFGYVITATFIVAIVRGAPEIRSVEPMVWLVVGLAAIPSVAAWTAIGRRSGVLGAFAIACLVEAAGVAASVVWVSVAGLFVAAVFLGGTFMGITALGLIAARGLSAGDPRRALGLMTAAFGLGQIVGPVVAGYGFDLTGSFFLPSMLAAAGLCVAAALMALTRRK
ncbi:MAG: YbfB/YjiJ family MFS transporter [Rhodospirillales bacterium]|nr:YbfB/YjiJ family MFS transporter [Rhodospirillales bacterium]